MSEWNDCAFNELTLAQLARIYRLRAQVFNGEQAASSVIYTRQEADAITFEADGQVLVDVEKYDLMV